MPSDISIASVNAAAAPVVVRAETVPATANRSGSMVASFPSPVGHLDAALGIEVMQFIDQTGAVTQSFPSQKQLQAYRDGDTAASFGALA